MSGPSDRATPKRVVAYLRVSTEEQASSGLGLKAQEEAIRKEVTARGWHLVGIEKDTAKGWKFDRKNRPGLFRAMDALGAGHYDVLMVSRLDRLARSVRGFADLLARANSEGWALVCLSPMVDMSDPFGRAMAYVASAFAELERELISLRTKEGLERAKAAGTIIGRRRSVELATVCLIADRLRIGATSEAIAYELNVRGVGAGEADEWTGAMVRKIKWSYIDPDDLLPIDDGLFADQEEAA